MGTCVYQPDPYFIWFEVVELGGRDMVVVYVDVSTRTI